MVKADDGGGFSKQEIITRFSQYLERAIQIGKSTSGLEEITRTLEEFEPHAERDFFPYLPLQSALIGQYCMLNREKETLLPENRTLLERAGIYLRTLFMSSEEKRRYIAKRNCELYKELAPKLKQMYYIAIVMVSAIESYRDFLGVNHTKLEKEGEMIFLNDEFAILSGIIERHSKESTLVADAVAPIKSNIDALYPQNVREWHRAIVKPSILGKNFYGPLTVRF